MELTIEQALRQGVTAHREGKLQKAERLYRAILQSQPGQPDANHNLGVIAVSVNKTAAALPLFKTALEANPKVEQFWLSYIDALIKEKQFENAKRVIEQAKTQGVAGDKLNVLETKTASINKKDTVGSLSPSPQQLSSLLEHYQNGRVDDAENLAISITDEFPKHPFAWKVLGAVLTATGRTSEAVDANQTAVALSPEDAEAHSNLGITLKEIGRLDEALASHNQAIALNPDFAEVHSNLGVTFHELGRLDEALASYNQAIASKPDYAKAHSNLGVTLQKLKRLDEALASHNQAIALKPDFAEGHSNLGVTFHELGRLDEALASYNQAIALKPDYAKAHNNLGVTLQELGRLDEALASYTQAIALKPDFAEGRSNLGVTFHELGRLDEALASYTQAITVNPDYAEVHRMLTSIKTFDTQDEQYSKMQEIYLNEDISEEQRCHINFGLAKACEDLGNFEQAFTHYSEGNVLRKKLLNYDINQDVELFKKIKSRYPKIEKNSLVKEKLSNNLTPIFIIGMPRSGTTLVEQIISSHSQVTGAGELGFVRRFGAGIATGTTEVNNQSLLDFRHKYLNKLQNVSNENLIVTDKTPQNFRYLGLLVAAFPEAKIVHVKRNPAAVCWANYKQYFASKNIGYCYAIDDVISYHKLYENLMEFWTSTLSKKIYNLDYEQLTVNQETETRQLIDYLGLDWDENCLSPQNNTRSVTTASKLQVRKKVYQGSSEQWKKYQPFLNGAFDGLLLR
ncbi:MAG: tetratricopeptide repeat protein [Rhodospirillaceae bacterium]